MEDLATGRLEMRRAKSTAKLSKNMARITLKAARKLSRKSIAVIKKIKRLNSKMSAMKSRALKVKPKTVKSTAHALMRLGFDLEDAASDLLSTARSLGRKKSLTPQTVSFLDLPTEIRLKIYDALLDNDRAEDKDFIFISLESLQESTLGPVNPMLRTCTQIYHEFLPVILTSELTNGCCSLDVHRQVALRRANLLDPRIFMWMTNSSGACITDTRFNYYSSNSRELMWNIHIKPDGQICIRAWYEWVHANPEPSQLKATLKKSNAELQVAEHLRETLPEMVKDNGLRGLGLAEMEVIRAVMALYLPNVPKSL